jgi:hypothetical protein
MKLLLLLLSLLLFRDIRACEPPFEPFASFDPAEAYEGEAAPTVPVARVAQITRGRPARRGESSCVDISSVTIAVRDDAPRLPFYFEFREVGGTAPDKIFSGGLRAGATNGYGERLFTFYWPEISPRPEPVDLQVEITPFTRSGVPGPSAVLVISDKATTPDSNR